MGIALRRSRDLGSTQISTPAGVVMPFAGSTSPDGWLLCYGQAISRTDYATLFSVLGTTYGTGDGSTTFNLPDMRGRIAAGKDDMGGVAASRLTSGGSGITGSTLGNAGGAETVTLTSAQSGVPAHSHANTVTNNAVTTGAGSAHQHANTLSSNTVASSAHRHDFTIALYDNAYSATGSNAAMGAGAGSAGAYRYSTGAYQGGVNAGSVTDTRRDATSTSAGASVRFSSTGDTQTPSATTTVGLTNANESAHTHSVTSNVSITNVDATAANAASAHTNTQPTIILNYIIKV